MQTGVAKLILRDGRTDRNADGRGEANTERRTDRQMQTDVAKLILRDGRTDRNTDRRGEANAERRTDRQKCRQTWRS
jgi:hypothetical protein